MIKIYTIVFGIIMLAPYSFGQVPDESGTIVLGKIATCEMTELSLDIVFNRFKDESNENSYLVIVGEKAKNEKKTHNEKRLKALAEFFEKRGLRRDRIVSAYWDSEEAVSRTRLFVGGKLVLIMESRPKWPFCTRCCIEPA